MKVVQNSLKKTLLKNMYLLMLCLTTIMALTACDENMLGLVEDHSIEAETILKHEQLIDSSYFIEPKMLVTMPRRTVSTGWYHTVVIRDDGSLWAWGLNHWGEVGDGTTTTRNIPLQIGTDTDWVSVSAGTGFSIALKDDGSLWSWGNNWYGQLGDGTSKTAERAEPVQVGTDTDWAHISAGSSHVVAIKTDGSLWAWGLNRHGQLGDGAVWGYGSYVTVPTRIGIYTDWAYIAAFDSHTVAIKTDGSRWAWGCNITRVFGDGTITDHRYEPLRSTPEQIGTDTDWISISWTTAIRADGSLWEWGFIPVTGQESLLPIQMGTDTDWVKVSSRVAIKTDGSLWSWGSNLTGTIGDGTLIDRPTPVQIGAFTDWVSVDTTGKRVVATSADGSIWTWGRGSEIIWVNLFGDGDDEELARQQHRLYPVKIMDGVRLP